MSANFFAPTRRFLVQSVYRDSFNFPKSGVCEDNDLLAVVLNLHVVDDNEFPAARFIRAVYIMIVEVIVGDLDELLHIGEELMEGSTGIRLYEVRVNYTRRLPIFINQRQGHVELVASGYVLFPGWAYAVEVAVESNVGEDSEFCHDCLLGL